MPRVSPFAVGAWLAATTVATAVSWAGVGAVTRAVAGSPDHVIPTGRLDAQPASAVPPLIGAAGPPATGALSGGSTASTATSTSIASTPIRSGTNASGSAPQTSTPPHDTGPGRAGSFGGGSVGEWPTVQPSSAPTTFASPGGQATVACRGETISLLSALPASGFQVSVQSGGPEQVAVSFSGNGVVYLLGAACHDGVAERTESGGGALPTTTTTVPNGQGSGPGGGPGGGPSGGSGGGGGGPGGLSSGDNHP